MPARRGTFPRNVRVVWTWLDSGALAVGTRGTTAGMGSIGTLAEVPLECGYLRNVHPSQCPSAHCCLNLGIWCTACFASVTCFWENSRSLPGRRGRVGRVDVPWLQESVVRYIQDVASHWAGLSVVCDDRASVCGSRHRYFARSFPCPLRES